MQSMILFDPDVVYCQAAHDGYLCWPPTPALAVAEQQCPVARLSDTTRLAFRRCGELGMWLGRKVNDTNPTGWTNYTPCFPQPVQTLLIKVSEDEENAQFKFRTAQITRYMEITGFSTSFVALVLSMIIFTNFRSLNNSRTRIHKSLFCAMMMQVVIRLIVYIDQARVRTGIGDLDSVDNETVWGIDNMPYICEISYAMLEYSITSMFMWMFVEGLYLHKLVTMNALRESNCHAMYNAAGWGLPVIVTTVWAYETAMHYSQERVKLCWYGYNLLKLYWYLEGPRLAVIVVNIAFHLNIMRVLIVKLRRGEDSEIEKVRKAVKAAFVLLPLLGITNGLNMIEAPLEANVWKFIIWSYTTHFLRSFQGFFISLIYCFMNGEVRQVLKKHYENYKTMKETAKRPRRNFAVVKSVLNSDVKKEDNSGQKSINEGTNSLPMRWFKKTSTAKPMAPLSEIIECSQDEIEAECSKSDRNNEEAVITEVIVSKQVEAQVTVHVSSV